MADPFVLSQEKINQLVIQIAQALGLVSADSTNLTQQQIDALKSAISQTDPTDVPDTQGAFTGAYKTVAGWITDNSDSSDPHAIDGVDKSAWTFLRAGANINAGAATAEALTAREYTRIEYELRFGTDPGDSTINKMSNGIAFNVMKDILKNDGKIPDIDTIAQADARVVVDGYFKQEQGAWVGNALFDYFGTNTPFATLDPSAGPYGTYDVFASMYAMQQALPKPSSAAFWSFLFSDNNPWSQFNRTFVMNHNSVGGAQTIANLQALSRARPQLGDSQEYSCVIHERSADSELTDAPLRPSGRSMGQDQGYFARP
jgi:hypothetical protein